MMGLLVKLLLAFHICNCEIEGKSAITIERILPSRTDFLVFNGDKIKTTCTINHENGIKSATWQFYDPYYRKATDLKVDNYTIIKTRYFMNNTFVKSNLHILKVPTLSSFYYRCFASFNGDTTDKELIQYKYIPEEAFPKVIISGSIISNIILGQKCAIEAKYNSEMIFQCRLDILKIYDHMAERKVEVKLTKNNATILTQIITYEKATSEEIVHHVYNLSTEDGGMYTCQSQLQIDRPNFNRVSSGYFYLSFPLRSLNNESASLLTVVKTSPGQTIQLVCDIEAYPQPYWSFYFNDTSVRNISNIKVMGNHLEIVSVKQENGGFYTCIAKDKNDIEISKVQDYLVIVIATQDTCDNNCDKHSPKLFLLVLSLLFTLN